MADYTYVKTGNYYVHKQGNDASYPVSAGDDISPAKLQSMEMQCVNKTLSNFVPKATVMAAVNACPINNIIIVKAGDYQETIQVSKPVTLDQDGYVVYRGNGTDAFGCFGNAENAQIICSLITDYAYLNNIGIYKNALIQCPIQEGYGASYYNCVFVGNTMTPRDRVELINCVLVNATISSCRIMQGCDVGEGCNIVFTGPSNFYVNNNYRGKVAVTAPGNGSLGRGSLAGVLLSFSEHHAEYPDYNLGSFAKPSLFNSVARLDFTYQSGSPNFFGLANSAIGGVGVARSMYLTDTYDTTAQPNPFSTGNGAVLSNLTQSGNDFVLIDSTQAGYIISAPIFNGATAKPIGKVNYIGKRSYNESTGGVYDCVPRVRRNDKTLAPSFSYFMRWSSTPAKPLAAAGYDNSNSISAGVFVPFLFGSIPQIDASGKGQADNGFNLATANEVGATWYQIRVEITNSKL